MSFPPCKLVSSAYKLNGPQRTSSLLAGLPMPEASATFDHDIDDVLARRVRHASIATRFLCSTAAPLADMEPLRTLRTQAPARAGIYVGGETISLADDLDFDLCVKVHGPDHASPLKTPNTLANVAGSQLAILTGITGPNCTIAAGETSGFAALQAAALALATDRIDAAVVTGIEVSSRYHAVAFPGMRQSAAAHVVVRAEPQAPVVFELPWIGRIDMSDACASVVASMDRHAGGNAGGLASLDAILFACGDAGFKDALARSLYQATWRGTFVWGPDCYGYGEACSGLLALGMADEWLSGRVPPGVPQGALPSRLAVAGLDRDGQMAVLVMSRRA